MSVYLGNKTDSDVSVTFQLVTDINTLSFDNSVTVAANRMRGSNTFATHAICSEAYQEKDFVVTAKVKAPGENLKIIGSQSDAAFKRPKFNLLENVITKMQGTNFTLVFGGEEVPCHKHILAAASPVLEAMVENKHREAIQSKANIKLLAEVGRPFLRFIYTGDLEEELLKEHTQAFLDMGEMYNLQELKNLAETEMLSQLTKENMLQMISLGEIFRADDIFEAALRMTKANMTWVRSKVCFDFWSL